MAELLDSALLASFGVHNNQIICDSGEQLTVLEIARVLPQQRLVCKCLFNANQVYVKIFTGLRANIHAAREAAGIKLLQNAKILTPNFLLETTINSQPILVFSGVENALNVESFMQQANDLARQSTAAKLTQTVAQLHKSNLMQTDIHLNNFLIGNDGVYSIDGDGIKQTNNQNQKQHNLATFLSKFDALDDDFMQDSVEAYFAALNKKFTVEQFVKIYLLTQKIRRETVSDYADKKVFRTCTDVTAAKPNGHFLAVASSHSIAELGFTPEALDDLIAQNLQPLKRGNSATVVRFDINDQAVALKRYNIKNGWHALKRALQPSRAAVAWANAHRLKLLNIATAKPLMLLETRQHGLRGKAYLLTEFIDAPDVASYFAQTRDKAARASTVADIATLFYKLYLLKLSHGDMKASNIKIVDNKPMLIDLDSMRQRQSTFFFERAHMRDLRRFMQNWQGDNALYNAFVKTFRVIYEDHEPLEKAGIFQYKELI